MLTQLKSNITILFFILATAVAIRFVNFPYQLSLYNDSARDVLISQILRSKGEWQEQGHYNTGTKQFYSPIYYNFLNAISIFSANPYFVYIVFILLQGISLCGYYVIGKNWFSTEVGLGAAIVTYFSSTFTLMINYPTPATWSVALFALSLAFFTQWKSSSQVVFLFFALAFNLLGVEFHTAQLFFSLFYLLVIVVPILQKSKKQSFSVIAITTIYILLLLASQFNTVNMLLNKKEGHQAFHYTTFLLNISNTYQIYLPNSNTYYAVFYYALLIPSVYIMGLVTFRA